MSLAELNACVRKMVRSKTIGHEDVAAAKVMLAPLFLGTFDVARIAKYVGAPTSDAWQVAVHLRESGVWVGRKVCANWNDAGTGGIALIMDIGVARGLMKRCAEKGKYK